MGKTPETNPIQHHFPQSRRVLFLPQKQGTKPSTAEVTGGTWKYLYAKASSKSMFLYPEQSSVQDNQALLLPNRNMQSLNTKRLSDPIPPTRTGKYLNHTPLVFPFKHMYFTLYHEIKMHFFLSASVLPADGSIPHQSMTLIRPEVGVFPTRRWQCKHQPTGFLSTSLRAVETLRLGVSRSKSLPR